MSEPEPDLERPPSLARRDFLRIVAGMPVAIGLPLGLAACFRADGEPARPTSGGGAGGAGGGGAGGGGTKIDVAAAVAAADRLGRPVLLIGVPLAPEGCSPDVVAVRKQVADNLAALLETPDETIQLVLGQLAIVVATEAEIRAGAPIAAPKASPEGSEPPAAGATVSHAWFLDDAPVAGERAARKLDVAMHGGEAQVPALARALREAVFGGEKHDLLAARRDREQKRLDAAVRERALDELNRLARGGLDEREAASAWLAEHREELIATIAWHALTSDSAEARARCSLIARPPARVQPTGTRWIEAPQVAEPDPCPPCGMVVMPPRAKDYLRILAGAPTEPKK